MSKKTRLLIELLMYESIKETNDPSDADKVKNIIEECSVTDIYRVKQAIVDATAAYQIIPPNMTDADFFDYLLIFTDQEISIDINASPEAETLIPKAAGVKTFVFFYKGQISYLDINNNSGNTAN